MATNDPAEQHPARLALRAWLDKRRGLLSWRREAPKTKTGYRRLSLECWLVNNAPVIIVLHPDGGWDLYTAPNTNDIKETLADADRRIGIPPAPPPELTARDWRRLAEIVDTVYAGEPDRQRLVDECLAREKAAAK